MDHPQPLQIISIVSRSPVSFYRTSIAFTDHSYHLQSTYTLLQTIYSFYRSFLLSPDYLYLFLDQPQILQIIPIVSMSPEHFYRISIPFTDHSYHLQVICTFLRTTIALQIIPIVSRASVPFYGPSIAFRDHSYRFQVTCTFLRTMHSFYISFLSSPFHLYLFTDHPQVLQIIPIVSMSPEHFYRISIPFTDHSYHLQVICTFLRTTIALQIIPIVSRASVPFYGPSIAFTDHSYRLQVTCTFLRTIHCFYRSFQSSPGHLYLFADHLQLLQIIPIISR